MNRPHPIAAVALAQQMLRSRRQREAVFGADLFADPAWDMLLDLFVARHLGQDIGTSSLCTASGVPQTTALRWITVLETRGLIVRAPDERDARRMLVSLTDRAEHTMRTLLDGSVQDVRAALSRSMQ